MFVRLGIDLPGAVSVVGYDDSKVARLSYLRLTTVSQDGQRLAAVAAERVIGRLERPLPAAPGKREVLLAPRIVVVRATTAPVAAPPDR